MDQRPQHLASLTSMRAVAALVVFLFHVNAQSLGPFTTQGRLGVSFFFVLSGLLLGMRHRSHDPARRFYQRRIARIYPAYLATLAVGYLLARSAGQEYGPLGLLSVVLLQAWVPDPEVYFVWNAVAWSLSAEAFFYAVFPLLAPAVLRLPRRATLLLAIACTTLVVLLGLWCSVAVRTYGDQTAGLVSWFVYIFPVARLAEFVLGICLVRVVHGPRIPVRKWQACVLVAVAYLLAGLDPLGLGLAAITLVPLALLLVVFSQADLAGEPSVAHASALVRLGEWSYCFYLVHLIVIALAERTVVGLFPHAVGVLSLPAAVLAAWLLHVTVERPFDTRLNGRGRVARATPP